MKYITLLDRVKWIEALPQIPISSYSTGLICYFYLNCTSWDTSTFAVGIQTLYQETGLTDGAGHLKIDYVPDFLKVLHNLLIEEFKLFVDRRFDAKIRFGWASRAISRTRDEAKPNCKNTIITKMQKNEKTRLEPRARCLPELISPNFLLISCQILDILPNSSTSLLKKCFNH